MKIAGKRKITTGFVIQTFDDDNKCIEQEFIAGDTVDYEDADGNTVDSWDEYQPFEMVQPAVDLICTECGSVNGFVTKSEKENVR